jgi:hypothetical protein
MYYELDWKVVPRDPELADTDTCDDVGVPWTMGVRYAGVVRQPIKCRLHPRRGRRMRDAFLTDIPLFSDRLINALHGAGVDNLDLYECEIALADGGVARDYKAVNIVGAVKCADLEQSQYVSLAPAPFLDFQRLVIDPKRARGLDLFRLGEKPLKIIISERVKRAVDAIRPVGMQLVPVDVTA